MFAAVITACLFASACANGPDVDELLEPAVAEAVSASPVDLDASAADLTTQRFTQSERELADLLLPPAVLPVPHRLIQLAVEDPNGDGLIGEYWYPPRILENDCSVRVDQAPTPIAVGAYIVGDPDLAVPSAVEMLSLSIEAPSSLTITITMLDTAEQRDALLETNLLFLTESLSGMDCDMTSQLEGLAEAFDLSDNPFEGQDPLVEEFFDSAMGDLGQFEPYDPGYPGWGLTLQGLFGTGTTSLYAVGDRIMLSVANARQLVSAQAGEPLSLDPVAYATVIQAQVDRLVAQGFG